MGDESQRTGHLLYSVSGGADHPDADLPRDEATALRTVGNVLLSTGRMLPSCSEVGDGMLRWASDLFGAAEELDPAPVARAASSLHAL